MNIADELDRLFEAEPPLPAPEQRLYAGRRALRRRRVSLVAVSAAAVAVGGLAWTTLPSGSPTSEPPLSGEPTITTDLPVVPQGECLGEEVCVELVPRGMKPLSPGKPGGDMALGYRDGELVKYWPEVEVVQAIEDPTGTGATRSAAVEVVFRDTRFRVAMAQGFGYLVDEVDEGDPATVAEWFAGEHALPANDCAVSAERSRPPFPRTATPDPGECWLGVDGRGGLVADDDVTVTRQFEPSLPDGALPPGIEVIGAEFTRDGETWFGVVRQIGGGAFVNATLVRVQDLTEPVTAEEWVTEAAQQPSMSGIPDGAQREEQQPEPWQTLEWWDPKTGAFVVPEGVTVIQKVDDPLELAHPQDSAGVVFELRGERYWVLTQVHVAMEAVEGSEIRSGGVTVSQAVGEAAEGSFVTWLADVVAEQQRAEEDAS